MISVASLPEITGADFRRFLAEQFAKEHMPDEWFEANDIAEDVFQLLVASARKETSRLLMMGMLEQDDGEEIADILENVCATMMISGFELGWEARAQFRSKP